jgi:hypothetical protein
LEYVVLQFGLLLGFWFFVWAAAMIAHRPGRESEPSVCYLWWMSAPMFCFFLLFSLWTHEEPNWPITAYLSGLVLAAAWLSQQLYSERVRQRRAALAGLVASSILGVSLVVLMHHTEWLAGALVRLSGSATARNPLPRRRLDPTCRLRGWRTLGTEVDRVAQGCRTQGIDPLLAATSWNVPGEMAFYCRGHPTVYSLGLAVGDRHSQYDLWHPNPVRDAAIFRGRTFIVIGEVPPFWKESFEHIDPSGVVTHRERGQVVAQWTVTVCRGFRGFQNLPPWVKNAPF